MKKLYSLIMAGVLMAALVVPAFAAPSPAADAVKAGSNVSVSVAGVSTKAASQPLAKAVVELTQTAEHMQNLGVAGSDLLVAAVLEVSFDGEIPAGGVKIPFVVSNAKSGDYVYVLHRIESSGQWEVVGQGYLGADLTITGTFTSFSPVALVIGEAPSGSGTATKAPKTGE